MTEQMIKQIKESLQRSKMFIALGAFESLVKENEHLKQRIDKARITLEIFENTEDNFEEVFCLEKLKELLGDTNDKR